MEARYAQTEGALRQFHQNFEKSRSEMIERFLQDQDDLNKKFEEYDFSVDDIEKDSRVNDHYQSNGVTAEDLHMNFSHSRGREFDQDSIRSLQTECSFTDSSEEEIAISKKSVKSREKSSYRNSSSEERAISKKPVKSRERSSYQNNISEEVGRSKNTVNSRERTSYQNTNSEEVARSKNAVNSRERTSYKNSSSEETAINKKAVSSRERSLHQNSRPVSSTRGTETVCQKLSLSTPRFEKPERRMEATSATTDKASSRVDKVVAQESVQRGFGRSKSLRIPGSSTLSKPSQNIEQPPNSPEVVKKHESITTGKPPLNAIRTGRNATEKSDRPKKLLSKRRERPSTAMGLCSPGQMSLTPDMDFHGVNRVPDGTSPWDTESASTAARTGVSVRSAPLPFKQKVVSLEPEQQKDNYQTFMSRRNSKVPPLPSNLSQGTDSGNPSYAQTYDTSVDNRHKVAALDNMGEKVRFRSVTPSYSHTYETSIEKQRNTQDKPKGVSRSKSINVKPFTKSQSDYFATSKMADIDSNCVNIWDPEPNEQSSSKNYSSRSSNDSQGPLRRYKGHGNLSRSEQTRVAQLAVLKLPPVSTKQPPDVPKRSGTSLSHYGKETTMMKMMPVHIGEEF